MAGGGDGIGRFGMPSNNEVKPVLDELILKRLNTDEIEDTIQIFLEACVGDESKIMINLLKIFLATVPEAALKDILTYEDVFTTLGYNVEVMQDDLKELNKTFLEHQQKRLKTYMNNFKMFMNELIHSETVTVYFKENHQKLSALNAMMRIMCSSEYIRVRDVGLVAILEMFCWLMKNEIHEQQNDDMMDVDDSMRMGVDGNENPFSTFLASNKARVLECIAESLVRDTNYTNRLAILNCIRENYRDHLEIVKHAGILKGLAFSIQDSSFAVQLSCIKFLLELLENFNDPQLINWFFDRCQISHNYGVVPVLSLIDNLTPNAIADIIDPSLKILICLAKHSPGRIHPTGLQYIFVNLCFTYKGAIKLVGELQHSVLCGLSKSTDLAKYDQYEKYMVCLLKFNHNLSKAALPINLAINPWMGRRDSPLLNFEYFMKYLLEGELDEMGRIGLLKMLRAILCQLKGTLPQELETYKRVMLVNDMSIDDRRDKIINFVGNFMKFLDGYPKNWTAKKECLLLCLNIIILIPVDFLCENMFPQVLKKVIDMVLFNELYNYKERHLAMKVLSHVYCVDDRPIIAMVKEILGNVIETFNVKVLKLAEADQGYNTEIQRNVLAGCQNLYALSECFEIEPVMEGLNCQEIVPLLSKFLLADDNTREAKMHVMKIRHSLLLFDINTCVKLFLRRHERTKILMPIYKLEAQSATYHQNITTIIPILIGWLGNLENDEEVMVFEMIQKEIAILQYLRRCNLENMQSVMIDEDFEKGVVVPLKEWIQARIPVHGTETTENMLPEKNEFVIKKFFSLLQKTILPISHFLDFLVFYLSKNHPLAIESVTKGKHDVDTLSTVLFSLMKLFLEEVKEIWQNSNNKKKLVENVSTFCMTIVKNIILSLMHEDYDSGRRVAQLTLNKLVKLVFETQPDVLPESAVAHFIFPWFGIVFEHCLPPSIYSNEDLLSWKALSTKYPKIAYLIVHLCRRADENMPPNLMQSIIELIFIPEKYIVQVDN